MERSCHRRSGARLFSNMLLFLSMSVLGCSLGSHGSGPPVASGGDGSGGGANAGQGGRGAEAQSDAPGDPDGTMGAGGSRDGGGEGGGGDGAGQGGGSTAACAGAAVAGGCWYFGAWDQSCDAVCEDHGGYSALTESYTGISSQGGSAAKCQEVLSALGHPGSVMTTNREDDLGLGCHVWSGGQAYWLTSPALLPSSSTWGNVMHRVCACQH